MLDLRTYSSPHFPGPSNQCLTTVDWGIELGGAAFGPDEGRVVVALDSNWARELDRAGLQPETLPNHTDSREMLATRPLTDPHALLVRRADSY